MKINLHKELMKKKEVVALIVLVLAKTINKKKTTAHFDLHLNLQTTDLIMDMLVIIYSQNYFFENTIFLLNQYFIRM